MRVYKSVTDLIGRTPLLELVGYEKKNGLAATLYAKLESFNPAGSVKDRVALAMIEDAEKKGLLKPGAGSPGRLSSSRRAGVSYHRDV